MAELHITSQDLDDPGFRLELPAGAAHRIVVEPAGKRAKMLEVDDTFFGLDSSIFRPGAGGSDNAAPEGGEPLTGIDLIAAAINYALVNPGRRLLVSGHTDTSGGEEHNVELSGHRASAVYGLIAHDRDRFRIASDAPHIKDRNKKTEKLIHERIKVLDWIEERLGWPTSHATNHHDYFRAVRALQRTYNERGSEVTDAPATLTVDADMGPGTWGAVFDIYQHVLAEVLERPRAEVREAQRRIETVAPGKGITACGEHLPIDEPQRDHYRSQRNRRVETLFFRALVLSDLPCLVGSCDPDACQLRGYLREPLPVATSTSAWRATWDDAETPAGVGLTRAMRLEAPGLAAGTQVAFEVFASIDGGSPRSLEVALVTAAAGLAERSFSGWYDHELVEDRGDLASGAALPRLEFFFEARAGEELRRSQRLPYSDTVDTTYFVDDGHTQPLGDRPFLLVSPWFRLSGRTTPGGAVRVVGLPPGGAHVMIDGHAT